MDFENQFAKFNSIEEVGFTPESSEVYKLKVEKALKKLKDPHYLPPFSEVNFLTQVKDTVRSYGESLDIQVQDFLDDDENAPEGEWHGPEAVYEIYTKEYIEHFSQYLIQQIETYYQKTGKPALILEVCAGNGKLTHFLGEYMESTDKEIFKKCGIIASDSGEWDLREVFPVRKMNHNQALERYEPTIVICSWMPYQEEDLSSDFRKTESVQEYILIGDQECCGHGDSAWEEHEDDFVKVETPNKETYFKGERDGFIGEYLRDLKSWQIGRTDILYGRYENNLGEQRSRSDTVSFRRK
jgi:hypothetical protein